MAAIRQALTFALLGCHLLLGGLLVLILFPFSSSRGQERIISWWSHVMLKIFGVSISIVGDLSAREHGHMLLVNHVSWIDVYAVNVYRTTRFVAKSEIRGWPLVGWMSARSGTIFLQRTRRSAVMGVIGSMVDALESGAVVGVFPEGTCTDGTVLLPFHANLIQAAINAGAKVIPATLRYRHADGRIALAAGFVGDMTLVDTAKAMIRARPLTVEMVLHPAIESSGLTRHQIAAKARGPMLASLGIEP